MAECCSALSPDFAMHNCQRQSTTMEAKGAAVATIPLFVKEKLGVQAYRQWLEVLSPTARTVLSGSILPSVWYPMRETLVEPTRAICDLFYGGTLKGATEQGRFSASHGLRGVFRLFVRIASPEFIIARASQILPSYYRPSTMSVAEKSPGHTVVLVTDFPDPDESIEHRMMGWMEQALIMCGVNSVAAQIGVSMTDGAPHTAFHVSWN